LGLELHGRELEPGHSLNVYISNPERKKERTDANANAREVYVAGLSRFATKEDLEKLFRTVSSTLMYRLSRTDRRQYGPMKEIRMALDADKHSKGFAFVEFEEEVGSYYQDIRCDSDLLSTYRQTPQELLGQTTTNSRSAGSQ